MWRQHRQKTGVLPCCADAVWCGVVGWLCAGYQCFTIIVTSPFLGQSIEFDIGPIVEIVI